MPLLEELLCAKPKSNAVTGKRCFGESCSLSLVSVCRLGRRQSDTLQVFYLLFRIYPSLAPLA